MHTRLSVDILCFAAPLHAHDTVNPRCDFDRHALLALDARAVDQTLPDGGWGLPGNIPGCQHAAGN